MTITELMEYLSYLRFDSNVKVNRSIMFYKNNLGSEINQNLPQLMKLLSRSGYGVKLYPTYIVVTLNL